MSGPHRLVSEARHALSTALAGGREPILLAVSGGSDSMALAATAAFIAPKYGRQVRAICVDHAIRPESAAEAATTADWLSELGIPTDVVRINASGQGGPEASARVARYQAIADRAREREALVVLGHTLSDQAETVLLGLARGSGARSIAGMPASGHLPGHPDVAMIRPFLGLSRADLRTVCRELDVPWVDDPTNELDSEWTSADGRPLRRVSVRHRVLPLMEETLGPGIDRALARTASQLRDDDEALSALAAAALVEARMREESSGAAGQAEGAHAYSCAALAQHMPAVRRRAIRLAMERAGVRGGEVTYWHVSGVDRLVTSPDNKVGLDLPGIRAWRDRGVMYFQG